MQMDDLMFQDCFDHWSKSDANEPFWGSLAEKYETTSEALRSKFKRERKRRGIFKTSKRTVQQNPRVGIFDVETLPLKIEGYLWQIHDQYIDHTFIKNSWALLGWAGKMLGESEVYSDIMTSAEALKRNSLRVTKSAREFVDSCDIIVGHNLDDFDSKILTTELTFHDLAPVKYRSIDTLKLIRSNYKLPSYKLDYVNNYFGITRKVQNEGQILWNRCLEGDESALQEMKIYNQGDVVSDEDLLWRILPYCNGVPNFSTYQLDGVQKCHCGHSLTQDKKHPYWFTNHAQYDRFVCTNCGSVHRGKKNLLSKYQHTDLKVSL